MLENVRIINAYYSKQQQQPNERVEMRNSAKETHVFVLRFNRTALPLCIKILKTTVNND